MWSQVLLFLALFGSPGLSQYDDYNSGDSCGNDEECTSFFECPVATNRIGRLSRCQLDYDDYYRGGLGVCCPALNQPGNGLEIRVHQPVNSVNSVNSVSDQMCEKFAEYSCIGPKSEQLITGGEDAQTDEFPHMVQLGFRRWIEKEANKYKYDCGGSLISDRWVLSAAHCAYSLTQKGYKSLRANIVRMGDASAYPPQVKKVVRQVIHPGYEPHLAYNDIALFQLESPVNFFREKHVRPICLNTQEDFALFPAPQAIGFGKTSNGSFSKVLQKVSLQKYTTRACNEKLVRLKTLPNGISEETMLCFGDRGGDGDTCNGDSGSSVSVDSSYKCLHKIVGVTSFGLAHCGEGNPAVYTRVSHYTDWIEKHVWPEEKDEWERSHSDNSI